MNRFLRKKTPEPLPTLSNGPVESISSQSRPTSPGMKKPAASRWRRNKKAVVEERPMLDISTALPSTDDFRTSLLMPNLSARFSMLREQDDPRSLLGKASDDSVLQPRRRSRMADFGHGRGNLGDIAEVDVASIKSSIRPPFLASSREQSYVSEDGYGSENDSTHAGSMMTRARPGEDNVFFGGRQKVYMIPNAGSSSRSLGRPVYDEDIGLSPFQNSGLSPFQKYKKQKDGGDDRPADDNQAFDFGLDETSTPDHEDPPNEAAPGLSHSPSLSSFEKKRSTTSTSRSEARSSYTAATSVGSHPNTAAPSPAAPTTQLPIPVPAAAPTPTPLKRADTKNRRLYEQGLDQHMYEQQTSALSRLNSIQRQRGLNGRPIPGLHGAKSASNLHDKTSHSVYALRGQSPTPAPPLASFGSIRKPHSNTASPNLSTANSPTNGDFGDVDVLNQAIEPGDRGKATAMGAFNKPQQAFDEDQYLERQRQLQRSHSTVAIKKDPAAAPSIQNRLGSFDYERKRTDSDASARSRSRTRSRTRPIEEEPESPTDDVQTSDTSKVLPRAQPAQPEKHTYPDTHRTFFGDISASESEDEEAESHVHQPDYGYGVHHGRWQPTILPSVSEHPALRSTKSQASLAEEDEDDLPKSKRLDPSLPRLPENPDKSAENTTSEDSPTVPTSVPLNGFVHHLRQPSNQSSVFQPESSAADDDDVPEVPEWNPKNLDVNRYGLSALDSESRLRFSSAPSNPWDLDDSANTSSNALTGENSSIGGRTITPVNAMASQDNLVSAATSQLAKVANASSDTSKGASAASEVLWQSELRIQHTRDASTETQQERDAFASELAARRQAIQENIKSMVERDTQQRAPSPSRGAGFKAMLRAKSSREAVVESGRREPVVDSNRPPPMSNKAMKTLGVGATQANGSSSAPSQSQSDNRGYGAESNRPRDGSVSRPPAPGAVRALHSSEHDVRRGADRSVSRERSDIVNGDRGQNAPPGRSTPNSMANGTRSRTNSEANGPRSRSRTGPYRDDLDRAMMEGSGFSTAGAPPDKSPANSRDAIPPVTSNVRQGQMDTDGSRSNSRNGFFERRGHQPVHSGSNTPIASSPMAPQSNFSHANGSVRNSPVASPLPYASNISPPIAESSTAPSPPVTSPYQAPSNGPRTLRKKTISKHDISEPTLLSTTSNIDTVELPEGASLKNGMESPPPIPPINPKRRGIKLFGLGRTDSDESTTTLSSRAKSPETATTSWSTRSPEPSGADHSSNTPPFEFPRAVSSAASSAAMRDRSASNSPRPSTNTFRSSAATATATATASTPPFTAHQGYPSTSGLKSFEAFASDRAAIPGVGNPSGSPERVDRPTGLGVGVGVEGAMF